MSKQDNWFAAGGENYARYRPHYPAALAAYLAQESPAQEQALDVGCGNGQFTRQLAEHFQHVTGLDPSASQIAHASAHPGIHYAVAGAEQLPMSDASCDLICAAQAAHWFDLPAFYAEVRRVARPQALLALISYGVLSFENAAINTRFQDFYHHEIGPWWPPERQWVDSGYAKLPFPFEELQAPASKIRCNWPLPAFLGYIGTWSALRRARDAGQQNTSEAFARDLARLWGPLEQLQPLLWPIHMRLGRLP